MVFSTLKLNPRALRLNRFITLCLTGEDIAKVDLIRQVIVGFSMGLQHLDQPELRQRPLKPENPLLYFHLIAAKYDGYPVLCLAFHQALKHVEKILIDCQEKQSMPKKKADQRLQRMMIPFVHTVRFYEVDDTDKLFTEIPSNNKIVKALKRGQETSEVQYHKEEVFETYRDNVLAALSGTYSPHLSRNVTNVRWGRQISYGKKYLEEVVTSDSDGDESSKAIPTVVNITFSEKTEEEADEGAYPIEEAEEIFEAEDNDLARILSLRQISPSSFQSYWSKHTISLNTYSSYCHAATAKVVDEMTDKELAVLILLVILIFFGFAPKKAANIVIKKMPASDDELNHNTIYCHPDGTFFFYRIAEDQVASIFAQKEDRSPGVYRDNGNIVVMTTGVIATILKSYLSRTRLYRGVRPSLFIYKDAGGKTQRFSLELFESIGRSLEDKCGPFPSVYAFSRSFYNYSTSRYHVDPLVAAYVADRATRELRAPIFYTGLTSRRLNEDLIEMQTHLLNDIADNAEECGIHLNRDILCSADPDLSKEDIGKVSFGSKFVPLMASMRKTLNSIKDRVVNEKGWGIIKRYNVYMFYNMLLSELICGFRQIEVERLDDVDVNTESSRIAVCGKGNRLYTESRLIFMHPFTTRTFTELRSCKSAFVQSLINTGKYSPSEMSEQLAAGNTFSIANSRGQLIPASSYNVRRFLAITGISFPYKLNSQRHLLRTFLFDKKVKYKYLAAYFGHQTKGKEYLSYYSLDSLKQMMDAISPHIDELVTELELEIISHTIMS